MKKITLTFICIISTYCINSQIYVSENFDSGTPSGWTDSYSNTTTSPCSVQSERDNLYSSSSTGNMTTSNFASASNGTDLTFSIDYKILDFNGLGATAQGWGTAALQYSTDDGTNWIDILVIDDSNHTTSTDCATASGTVAAANLPVGSDVKLRISNVWTAGDYYFYIDNFNASQVISCPQVSSITVSNISTSSAELLWTAGDSETLWNIEYGLAGYTQGNGTTVSASTNPYTLNGLTSGTTYDIYIQADCGAGDTSDWVGPVSFTLACDTVDSFSENFDGVSSMEFPDCWAKIGSSGTVRLDEGYDNSAPNALYLYSSSTTNIATVGMVPVSNLGAGTHRFTFNMRANFTAGGVVEIGYLTDANDPDSFISLGNVVSNSTSYESYTFTPPAGTYSNYPAMRHTGSPANSISIDDVVWEQIPSCLEVSEVAAVASATGFEVSWTSAGSEAAWNVEYGTSGYSQGSGTSMATSSNSASISGLSSNTSFDIYVQADCGDGDTGAWVGPLTVSTHATCGDTLYDSGGATGDYANNELTVVTVSPTNAGDLVTLTFNSFDTESGYDKMWVYDGPDESGEVLLNGVSGTTIPSPITSSHATGSLTVKFDSDGSTTSSGYKIDITCAAAPTDAMDWNNLQWLQPTADGSAGSRTSVTVDAGTSISAYAQGYEAEVTNTTVGSAGAGIECWIGIHNENTDPATWPASAWSVATFDSEQVNNDEYKLTTADAPVGTNYVASRWRLNNAGFTYGGTNPSDPGQTPGGPWDGTTNVSIQLVVNPIANDDCSGAISLTVNSDLECGTVTSGSVEFATDSGSTNTCSLYAHADDDVWYSFVATSESHVVSLSNVSGSVTDMYHALYEGDCNTLGDPIKCSDSNTSETTGLTIGNTYYVQVYTYTLSPGQNTSFDICVGTPPPPPANDSCDSATVLDTLPYTSNADATSATNNSGVIDNVCGTNGMNDGVWYTFTPTVSGTIDLTLTPTGWDAEIAVYTGSCGVFTCVDRADSGGSGGSESLSISVTAGTQYFVNLGHYSDFSDYSEGVYEFGATSTDASLGIEDNSISLFNYFPNPVNDMLTIRAQKDVDDITVYNMLGQVVKRQSPNTRDCTVDLSAMQSGAYFVQVSIDNTVETVRILKN